MEGEWNKGAVDEEVVEACDKNPLLFAYLPTSRDSFKWMAFVFSKSYIPMSIVGRNGFPIVANKWWRLIGK